MRCHEGDDDEDEEEDEAEEDDGRLFLITGATIELLGVEAAWGSSGGGRINC